MKNSAFVLEHLCRTYWCPLYAYLRRMGCNAEAAEDLVQEFFLYLLKRQVLRSVDREGGRFCSFLLPTLKNYLSDQRDKDRAQKRGAGRPLISWEQVQAEQRFSSEPCDEGSADRPLRSTLGNCRARTLHGTAAAGMVVQRES